MRLQRHLQCIVGSRRDMATVPRVREPRELHHHMGCKVSVDEYKGRRMEKFGRCREGFVIVPPSFADSGENPSCTAHVYELAVWALACPPMLDLDI